jgi:hypothetical protein
MRVGFTQALAAMDVAYITLMVLIAGGAISSAFVRTKRIIVVGAALMGCALVGLAITGSMIFGVAAMGIPVVFGMLAVGSAVAQALRTRGQNGRS